MPMWIAAVLLVSMVVSAGAQALPQGYAPPEVTQPDH